MKMMIMQDMGEQVGKVTLQRLDESSPHKAPGPFSFRGKGPFRQDMTEAYKIYAERCTKELEAHGELPMCRILYKFQK